MTPERMRPCAEQTTSKCGNQLSLHPQRLGYIHTCIYSCLPVPETLVLVNVRYEDRALLVIFNDVAGHLCDAPTPPRRKRRGETPTAYTVIFIYSTWVVRGTVGDQWARILMDLCQSGITCQCGKYKGCAPWWGGLDLYMRLPCLWVMALFPLCHGSCVTPPHPPPPPLHSVNVCSQVVRGETFLWTSWLWDHFQNLWCSLHFCLMEITCKQH